MGGENPERTRELLTFDLQLRRAAAAGLSFDGVDALPELPAISETALPDRVPRLVGFDEAGRGALAGPVTVACVAFDLAAGLRSNDDRASELCRDLSHLDDSKRVTPRRRVALCERIRLSAYVGVGHAAASEIDSIGIVSACRRATARALQRSNRPIELALFDRGLSLPAALLGTPTGFRSVSLTRGDARSFHIAAASIVAKVTRDALMGYLDERFPGYGFAKHKGYATVAHRQALSERGSSWVHRGTFLRKAQVAKSQFC